MPSKTPSLADFANSDRQAEAIRLLGKLGSICKVAMAMGIRQSSCSNLIHRVKKRAAVHGWSPDHDMTKSVPEPFVVSGTSTLYDADGKPSLQWVKTKLDNDRLVEIIRETVEELKANVKPLPRIAKKTKGNSADDLTLYTLSDAHIGMLAWHEDGGDNWDVDIAEKTISEAMASLIDSSPDSKVGFFAQLGDGLHSDGMVPVTPAHGNVLDQDGRFAKVVRAAVRIFRNTINLMLEKHDDVVVLMAQGNHDPASSVWLQEMFSLLYEKNQRVNVVVSPKPYYAYEHGHVMLGFHHGHKKKPEQLPEVFLGEFRDMYGRTKQTYIHCGHMHSIKVIECNSAIVQQHSTIAARDAYSSHGGYKSRRAMTAITYHKTKLKRAEITYHP